MGQVLDYATPPKRKQPSFTKLTWAVVISIFEHLLIFGVYAAALDGGVLGRQCAVASLGYWLVVLIIAVRRRRCPTELDLAFVVIGYPLMLFPSLYIVNGGLF